MAVDALDAELRVLYQDRTLVDIYLWNKNYTDENLEALMDYLIEYPNNVASITLSSNPITDVTGVKLARFIAKSSSITAVHLTDTRVGTATHLAIADAMHTNTSLRSILLHGGQSVVQYVVDAAFISALRVNPQIHDHCGWNLYSQFNEFYRLKNSAMELGHPSLQMTLVHAS